jgi:hypothetical protein
MYNIFQTVLLKQRLKEQKEKVARKWIGSFGRW